MLGNFKPVSESLPSSQYFIANDKHLENFLNSKITILFFLYLILTIFFIRLTSGCCSTQIAKKKKEKSLYL